ncbi:AI-2E family transporter [Glaciihabitans sp. INWT7]|uniref:AI-2E family transporter n=1 Tax=Glaciihabitans sp. INWT7 TaxID=2596912 RepID=UPI0016290A62|nr:AI-2E family transporter [Glaciihabitans sp. INWT7]QNE47595.1 AI-2E family transporter [Glaciihabitans sp. INWT7]
MTFGPRKRTPTLIASAEANTARDQAEATLPAGIRIAGSWSWRLLAIAAVIALFIYLVITLREIVVPFMIAILLAALLVPLVSFLVRHRWPKWLAVALAEIGLIAVVAGLVVLVVLQVRSGFPDLQKQSVQAYDDFKQYLLASPLHLTNSDINGYLGQAWTAIQKDSQALVSGAVSFGTTAGHVLAGMLLTLFATLFMLIDGKGIWAWVVRLFPRKARPAVDGSGKAGWVTLTNFVRVQIFVAFVDAVGIGLGAWIIGLFFGGFPLVIPITIAVFLGSFIPVIGALFSGVLAIFIALVYLNPFAALLMLAVVIAVQQIEGHVLQPFIMGTAVKVHPLAVVFAVAAGGFLAGIPGALFAVPVIATLNVMVNFVASGQWRTTPDPTLGQAVKNA